MPCIWENVQSVKSKITMRECVIPKKKYTVQEDPDDSDDLSDTFFIKMVSCEKLRAASKC